MPDPCPPIDQLLQAQDDPDRRRGLLLHAAGCADCRDWLGTLEEEWETASRPRALIRWRFAAAAAGLLVLAGTAIVWSARSRTGLAPARSYALPAGDRVEGAAGEFSAGPDRDRFLSLEDGTRLRLEPGARVRFHPPGSSDRLRLELVEGSFEAEVAPGKGTFRVTSQAGEIQVLGTRFWARIAQSDALCVEVSEGRILLRNGTADLLVLAGERGVLIARQVPAKLPIRADAKALLESLAGFLEPGPAGFEVRPDKRDEARLLALFLAAGRWESPALLDESPADADRPRQAKRFVREFVK